MYKSLIYAKKCVFYSISKNGVLERFACGEKMRDSDKMTVWMKILGGRGHKNVKILRTAGHI